MSDSAPSLKALLAGAAEAHRDERAVTELVKVGTLGSKSATCTYAELDRRADRLADRLTGSGLGPGDVAAVVGPRSIDFVVGLIGVIKSGAAFLLVDSAQPPQVNESLALRVLNCAQQYIDRERRAEKRRSIFSGAARWFGGLCLARQEHRL